MVSNGAVSKSEESQGADWVALYLIGLILVAFLLALGAIGAAVRQGDTASGPQSASTSGPTHPALPLPSGVPSLAPAATPSLAPSSPPVPVVPTGLPGGVPRIFADKQMLIAYYGTAGSGALGVLGEKSPDAIFTQLVRAGRPFAKNGRTIQPVFELIVTIAHAGPTKTGTYSSDIARADVQRYIEAAHRHGVLLVLDLQPGRDHFLRAAKRWEWALKDPWVGLALDPEWRMGPRQVPGRVIGSVSAAEVNQVSKWLDTLTEDNDLPEKILLLHQFRTSMVRDITAVVPRDHLALVQHIDGFGSPGAKLATYRTVAKPRQFTMGFKLFYDEDVPRMTAAQVLRIRPQVRFVSFQ